MGLTLAVLGGQPDPAQKPRPFEAAIDRIQAAELQGFCANCRQELLGRRRERSGELELKAEYQYESLEQIPGAAELIGEFSGALWRSPNELTSCCRWRAAG